MIVITSPAEKKGCIQKHCRRQSATIYIPIHKGYRNSLAHSLVCLSWAFYYLL